MKKAIYILSTAALVFASCDPVSEDGDFSFKALSEDQLAAADFFTYVQKDKAGNVKTDGNYFTYTTSPATIVDVIIEKADGTIETLTKKPGASGEFELSPKRGSDPNQTIYIRQYLPNESQTLSKRVVNVFVAQDLEPQIKLLASNNGQKVWMWDTEGKCWGNCDQAHEAFAEERAGQWWGVDTPDSLITQLQHAGGTAHGDEDANAYMIFTEDGKITSYRADGTTIHSTTYKWEGDYDGKYHDYYYAGNKNGENAQTREKWTLGIIRQEDKGILFPYAINENGAVAKELLVSKLTVDKLVLVHPGDHFNDWGGECTFWRFKSTSDVEGLLTANKTKSWTWDTEGNCWGNCDQAHEGFAENRDGQWWGLNIPDSLLGQLQHAGGIAHGDESPDAYCTFTANGEVASYNAAGKVIYSTTYKVRDIEKYDGFYHDYYYAGNKNGENAQTRAKWCKGIIDAEGPSILFPYAINEGGAVAKELLISKLTEDKLVLVHPGDHFNDWGGECTYWRFKKK